MQDAVAKGPAKIPAASGEVSPLRKKRDVGGDGDVGVCTGRAACACAYTRAHVIRHPTRSLPVIVLAPRARCWRVRRAMTRLCLFYPKVRPARTPRVTSEGESASEFRPGFFPAIFPPSPSPPPLSPSLSLSPFTFSLPFFPLSPFSFRCAGRLAAVRHSRWHANTPRRAAPGVDNDACIDAVSPAAHRFPFV